MKKSSKNTKRKGTFEAHTRKKKKSRNTFNMKVIPVIPVIIENGEEEKVKCDRRPKTRNQFERRPIKKKPSGAHRQQNETITATTNPKT